MVISFLNPLYNREEAFYLSEMLKDVLLTLVFVTDINKLGLSMPGSAGVVCNKTGVSLLLTVL